MKPSKQTLSPDRRHLLALAILVLLAVVLLPQLDSFSESIHLLRTLDGPLTVCAIGLTLFTYFAAGATYCFLAFKKLPYLRTVVAQFAAMFINRLLPSGLGALGVNYAYLHKMHHKPAQAAAVIGVNNLFGLLGHVLVVGVMVTIFHANMPPFNFPVIGHSSLWIVGVSIVVVGTVLLLIPNLRTKLLRAFMSVIHQLGSYRHRPASLLVALSSSTLLTICNMFSLYICLLALGGHLSFVATVIVFTIGIGAGTAIPSPGGLGGFEAGLVAGYIAYDVPQATAVAAVILYRLISYWLTLATGCIAFIYCQRRNYFGL